MMVSGIRRGSVVIVDFGLDGKSIERCVADLRAAHNPVAGQPSGPADVELAVDPYFPNTIVPLPPELRGRAVHPGGRNRLFLDSHAEYFRDARTQ